MMSPSFGSKVDTDSHLDNDTPSLESAKVLSKRGHEHHRMTNLGKHHQNKHKKTSNKRFSKQLQHKGQNVLAQLPFDLDKIKLADVEKIPLPAGLQFPSGFSLDALQRVINDFHIQETRTDILSDLPLDFEPNKSIYSFLYVMNTYRDPEVSSLVYVSQCFNCHSGNFCPAPNVTVPCIPGFYCPKNTAQPTLCCKGYLCSADTKTIEVCPERFFCPIASTRALPCNFLAFCPKGTSAVEKYGVGAILFAFALIVMAIFAIKKRIFRAQRIRYLQRLRELGDNSEDLAGEKRTQWEAAEVAQSIILEDQRKAAMSASQVREGGIDFGASQRSLALAQAAAGNMNVSTISLPKAERSFDIRFEKLGLTLPTGVDIIKNISGRLITGRTCAVMGPSGAGKTTFLSILAGKVAKTDGSIKVNGKEQTLSLWKKLIGFVPQEDVMLSDLSVREILMHSARMRQPAHMSHNEKRLKVLEVIQFLGLGHIMDNPIGDVETRGISGGERKRVNIGMELVASPSILFLDEPTSGLDSATSLEVCKLLKQIAQEQYLTVAAVVHSPSPHAFNQFDDLLLLGSGGRVIYSGPRNEAAAYFESIGYPVPDDESPADFFIALAAGRVDKSTRQSGYESDEDPDEDQARHDYEEPSKPNCPRDRTRELFREWEAHCRNKDLSKTLEKHAIRESDTMITVQLSSDESSQKSPEKRSSKRQSRQYPSSSQGARYTDTEEYDDDFLDEKRFSPVTAASTSLPPLQGQLHERECHVSTMALHQPSRPQSPTFSVALSHLAGSSVDTMDGLEAIRNSGRQSLFTTMRLSLISSWADTCSWFRDVGEEMSHWLWSIKCKFTGEKDPVRETPTFASVFLLCFKRACLQNYRSQLGFLSDQSLHLACGLCVSFASKDMTYIPRQPAEICAMAPVAIQLSCATPMDDIRYVGMFMALGVFFAGISVGASTFGDEKAVFWRDTSAGMPTLPYYMAKFLADVPRMIVAACMYTGAFIFFFAYRQQMGSLFLVILLLYINAFSIGYFVSAVVSRPMFGLTGTGMSLAWALVLSGTAPRLYKVFNNHGYTYVRWVWQVSAPRWGVEAFYLKEMDSRIYNEIKHNSLGDMYAFEHYENAIMSMVYIGLFGLLTKENRNVY
ncbi:hypothetical protein BGZ74_001361 [Mortierella antarctica]|nr:hypothetical protein BGZ74_001361 [Mortierella antarctica]